MSSDEQAMIARMWLDEFDDVPCFLYDIIIFYDDAHKLSKDNNILACQIANMGGDIFSIQTIIDALLAPHLAKIKELEEDYAEATDLLVAANQRWVDLKNETNSKIKRLEEILSRAQYAIVVTQGLFASDLPWQDRLPHLENGTEVEWQIDDTALLKIIDEALSETTPATTHESQITELKEQLAKAEGRNKVFVDALNTIIALEYLGNNTELEKVNRLIIRIANVAKAEASDTAGSEGQGN